MDVEACIHRRQFCDILQMPQRDFNKIKKTFLREKPSLDPRNLLELVILIKFFKKTFKEISVNITSSTVKLLYDLNINLSCIKVLHIRSFDNDIYNGWYEYLSIIFPSINYLSIAANCYLINTKRFFNLSHLHVYSSQITRESSSDLKINRLDITICFDSDYKKIIEFIKQIKVNEMGIFNGKILKRRKIKDLFLKLNKFTIEKIYIDDDFIFNFIMNNHNVVNIKSK
ncbi:putative NADH ubiquinone oxidoreductase [Glossina pallidipes salivary gland hypertrophy virus]|uniref:Putative NADH ubiquinone oxidoreductase n=1 Tax=Glossina hytrovirus (isolate Glossina pallidipes/Ethiopia/Seibersdorf/-) TaxID=379529 RepID=A0A0Y0G796_GHVS|nr:putative NADH ubiquinone oxidoreductase [Glossina pallidipes salivary gland hypertrophy virus]